MSGSAHAKAAERHAAAAKSHRKAARHLDDGNEEKAAKHAAKADDRAKEANQSSIKARPKKAPSKK
ncbi:hypothetical protein MKK84_16065 [Methylobacterium sp. E-065]|uniref:hypothetical protein n=1 Tax=Methylobacterium sp. E-065 TaxID=2836583 RepID=UPI001FB9B924|nr:hypothetical protein [Methylobacterium sp. E-065]MCJ2018940.1 hypothetical protein [Methylobacterium sp. E-065]